MFLLIRGAFETLGQAVAGHEGWRQRRAHICVVYVRALGWVCALYFFLPFPNVVLVDVSSYVQE